MAGGPEGRPRVGLLGGTFDPVHRGHLALARGVATALSLDRVLLVPAATPPHKRAVAPVAERLAMLRLALADDPRMGISLVDVQRPGPCYTVETLARLHRELGPAELFFIIGGDSFAELTSWKEPQRLLDYANLVVVARPGAVAPPVVLRRAGLLFAGLQPVAEGQWRSPAGETGLYLVDIPVPDCASTGIRAGLARGEDVTACLPAPVAAYIAEHGLYRGERKNQRDGEE